MSEMILCNKHAKDTDYCVPCDLESELAAAQSDAEVSRAAYEAVKTIGHRLESELAAAKAENQAIRDSYHGNLNSMEGCLAKECAETGHLREEIENNRIVYSQARHEAKALSLEAKRLHVALKGVFDLVRAHQVGGMFLDSSDQSRMYAAQAALDGPK